MTPMVFCASFPPCPREKNAADTNCNVRKVLSTADGVERTNAHETMSTSNKASKKPSSGDSTMAAAVTPRPLQTIAVRPAFIIPAPANPPIKACELLEGIPQPPGEQIPADRS